jgi:Hint domain-containing protein
MTIPSSLARAAQLAVQTAPGILQKPGEMRPTQQPSLRRYEVSALLPNGNIAETRHVAPALPIFEDAFCAFSRGSILETESGPMAIEDLLPGDRVVDIDGDAQSVQWKGTTTLNPGSAHSQRHNLHLTRLMADSFGMQRPTTCMIAGPSARLLHTPTHLRAVAGNNRMLTPVQEFVDGINVIETAPPTPVELFHICLPRHAVIRVGGLEFESFHPGINAARNISHAMRSLFLNLFAHIEQLSDFGMPAYPRAGDGQLDAMSA